MTMRFSLAIASALCIASAIPAQAAVHKVKPGQSIQAAINIASPGDTILVEPGEYREYSNGAYGLRITTDNLRLIGLSRKLGDGVEAERVRLIKNESQETGVFAAPAGCDFRDTAEQCKDKRGESEITYLKNFYIRGFSVEEFPVNGIQTRWVDGFEFVRNHSVNNLNNGIYPTLSANGLVRNNVSYGSLDTAMWIAGSENVRVIGNELHSSVIGFEITVSDNVEVTANQIYNNNVGVGLFHPDGAGNPPLPTMENWNINQNSIYANNGGVVAPPGSFQSLLPPGAGVLLLGVSGHQVTDNSIEENGLVGVAVFGWCTSLIGTGRDCTAPEPNPLRRRDASNNLVKGNFLRENGLAAAVPPPTDFSQDLAYFHAADINPAFGALEPSGTGNCFADNYDVPGETPSFFSSTNFNFATLNGTLPTDGC